MCLHNAEKYFMKNISFEVYYELKGGLTSKTGRS